ncbi:MAG: tetratricopeptide repeat-containing sensor histidine kinase [Lutibacter sp.]|nr:tetratricopeptide repeat-containing sensor histidine kinase [Lutibacter sp.]
MNTYKLTFFVLVFFTFNNIFSQNINKELLNKLKTSKSDTSKIKLLIDIGNDIYYSFPDTSFIYYKKAYRLSKQLKNKKLEASCLLNIGYYLDAKEQYEESLEYYLNAIELYKSINDEHGIANCYYYIGYGFSYLNLPEKAIKYYYKALKIFEKLNEKNEIADINNGFGNLFYEIKNYKEAYKYYLKAYTIYNELNDEKGLLAVYINLGNSLSENGKINEGLKYYFQSVELCEKLDDHEGLVMNYSNIGDCYLLLGDYKKAMLYFEDAIKLSNKIKYKYLLPTIYSNIAHTQLKLKNYNLVIEYAKKSLDNSKDLSISHFAYENHKYLSECYEELNDYKNAFKHQKLFKKFSDSVFNSRKFEQVAKLSVINKLEGQEKRIDLLSKNDEISSLKIQSQKTISKTLIISTIILIGVFFLLIKQRIAKNKAYNLLKIEKEKALESDQLKSAFLANMSHEIRTPMNAIMGFSEFLKNPSLPIEKRIKFVDIINKSGVRLMTIINDIIDISKIESNQLKLEIREINIIQILKDIVEIQKNTNPQFLAKNIELKYNNLNEYDVLLLKTDENRFVQIVNNLINNAIKFTDNGFVEVGFIKKIHLDKNYIEFYVKDTGCGVSADKFELIFDRFSQAGEHDFKIGNGLGLSICKGILKLLRGEIWLESKVNVGTTFYFTLPY